MYSKLVKSIFIISCGLSLYSHSVDITFGSIEVIEFNSDVIGAREILLYKPHSKEINSQTRFIIFQDGQMLFDASRSWNKQEWGLDETFLELNNENIRPTKPQSISYENIPSDEIYLFGEYLLAIY